jgi:hypothetical protein
MVHETDILIKMSMPVAEFRRLAEKEPVKAADSLDTELQDFEAWVMRRGMGRLTKVERQILREYLGFKLVT